MQNAAPSKQVTIRCLQISGREPSGLVIQRAKNLESRGIRVLFEDLPPDLAWPVTASSPRLRRDGLMRALQEPDSQYLIASRGGFGASDLLPLVDWDQLKELPPKILIGQSDISALHCAFVTQLNWPGLNGPMLGGLHWDSDEGANSIDELLTMIKTGNFAATQSVVPANDQANRSKILSGWLFGGCFSVLTNLIGTPFFPKKLQGAILLLEDTGENPGRLMRFWGQWQQSRVLDGVQSVILAPFVDCNTNGSISSAMLVGEFCRRTHLPVFTCENFGHVANSRPMGINASCQLSNTSLTWKLALGKAVS